MERSIMIKGLKKYQANYFPFPREAIVAILTIYKVEFKTKGNNGDKKRHYII